MNTITKFLRTIANGIIPSYLFRNSNLSGQLIIPKEIKTIQSHAFENCQNITEIIFEAREDYNPIEIEEYAFYNCQNLTNVILPDTSSNIHWRAFGIGYKAQYPIERTITIPPSKSKTMTTIEKNAFTTVPGDTNIVTINIQEKGRMFNKYCKNANWFQYADLIKGYQAVEVSIAPGTSTIPAGIYNKRADITKVTIPSSVTTIEENAFKDCYALHTIVFEDIDSTETTLTIGESAFENCHGLYQIILPKRLKIEGGIGKNAFKGCYKLVEIVDQYGYFKDSGGSIIKSRIEEGDWPQLFETVEVPNKDDYIRPTENHGCIGYYLASMDNVIVNRDNSKLSTKGNLVCYTGDMRTYYNIMHSTGQKYEKIYSSDFPDEDINKVAGDGAIGRIYHPRNDGEIFLRTIKDTQLKSNLTSKGYRIQPYGLYKTTDVIEQKDWKYIIHADIKLGELVINPVPDENDDKQWQYVIYPYFAYKNYGIEKLVLGKYIKYFGYYCFADTLGIMDIEFDCEDVKTMSIERHWDADETEFVNGVFSNCGKDEYGVTVYFGDSVKQIDYYLFQPCHRNNTVSVLGLSYPKILFVKGGDQINTIFAGAFNSNQKLSSFYFGKAIKAMKDVGSVAFGNCPVLRELYDCTANEIISTTVGGLSNNVGAVILYNPDDTIYYNYNNEFLLVNYYNEDSPVLFASYIGFNPVVNIPEIYNSIGVSRLINIGNNFLYGANNLKQVVLNNSVQTIGVQAFANSTIEQINFNNGLKEVGNYAFSGCGSLEKIIFNDDFADKSLTLKQSSFQNCIELKKLPNLEKIKLLEQAAFAGCTNAAPDNEDKKTLVFPNWPILTNSSQSVFQNCDKIISIIFGQNNPIIPASAFNECGGIAALDFTNTGVKSIGVNAFNNCDSLNKVIISNKVNTIGAGAFSYNEKLNSIEVQDGNSTCYSDEDKNILICYETYNGKVEKVLKQFAVGKSDIKNFRVPDGIYKIDSYAFGCDDSNAYLEKIFIPKSVKIIANNSVFAKQTSLTIYCEISEEEKPAGWVKDWQGAAYEVKWNVTTTEWEKYINKKQEN